MKLSASLLFWAASNSQTHFTSAADGCSFTETLPINDDDFGEPFWEEIIEAAFPTWRVPDAGCPRLDKVGGALIDDNADDPFFDIGPEEGKFNPCYYTKAFAGLDPKHGGYPTPIDTHYPYEFAAPFFKQPGDGSTHHCPINADPLTPVQSCPKINSPCDGGEKDCVKITDEYGIGHVPPFVPLAAIKNEFNQCDATSPDICTEWFDFETNGCNIKESVLTELVNKYFGTAEGEVKFQPPILLDGAPSSTYYRLEYINENDESGESACKDDNCRGPHYCSKEAAEEDIWGDFCPYVHTGENSGQYRHPHIALAALELWFANKCNPTVCPSTWLDSPNAEGYGDESTSTSITWSEMEDNDNVMSQPMVPYKWPNCDSGLYPGHDLYGDQDFKKVDGVYVLEKVFDFADDVNDESAASDTKYHFPIVLSSVALMVANLVL